MPCGFEYFKENIIVFFNFILQIKHEIVYHYWSTYATRHSKCTEESLQRRSGNFLTLLHFNTHA